MVMAGYIPIASYIVNDICCEAAMEPNINLNAEALADMLAVFTNVPRLRILEKLLDGPRIVGDLVRETGYAQAVISKQIGILREAGLLQCNPQGRCREYKLADSAAVRGLLEAASGMVLAAASNQRECEKLRHVREI